MLSLPKITASLLLLCMAFGCFAQDGSEHLDEILQLTPEEIKAKKVKSCSSVIYYTTADDTSCTYGDYFVFDSAGRVAAEMIYSYGGLPETRTFAYDPATNRLAETKEFNTYTTGPLPMDQAGKIKSSDRDSMLQTGRMEKSMLWRNGKEIHTTYYDDGNVEWDMYPVFDERDSIVQIRLVELGVLRDVWVYRPNGKLLVDTSFDDYGIDVENYNEYGHSVLWTSYDEDGKITDQSSTEYKYDAQGRQREVTEKDRLGNETRKTTTTYDAAGRVTALVRMENGKVIREESRTVRVAKADTIITSRFLFFDKSFQIYHFRETIERIMPREMMREVLTKRYATDANKKIVGDTTVEISILKFDKRGDIISSVTTVNGKEESRFSGKYDAQGRPLLHTRTNTEDSSTQTFTYYSDGTNKTYSDESWGNIRITKYNPQGKVVERSQGIVGGMEEQRTQYTFNEQGLLIRKEVFEGGKRIVLTEFTYTFYP